MKRKMILRTLTLLTLTFLMGTATYAQEKKEVKKIKIITIDDNGNKVVEERVLEGDNATIILNEMGLDGEELDLEKLKHEFNINVEMDEDGFLAKEKIVEMENGKKIVSTIEYKKDENGNYVKHEVEEVDGIVTKDETTDVSKEEMDKMSNHKVILKSMHGDQIGENGKDCKMIIIRKDIDGDEMGHDMKWVSEDGEEMDISEMLKKIEVNVELEGDGDDRKVIIKKHMIFIKIDDLDKSDIEVLNKASEGGMSFEDSQSLNLDRLEFYPNPNNGQFTLDFQLPDSDAPADIKVMSLNGKEIFNETFQNESGAYKNEIDLSNFPGGVYFLSITQAGKQIVKKVVLQ